MTPRVAATTRPRRHQRMVRHVPGASRRAVASLRMETLTVSLVRTPGSTRRGGEGTSQKDGGADQEERRCADLDGDQGLPCAARTRIPRHFAAHRRAPGRGGWPAALARARRTPWTRRRQPPGTSAPASPRRDGQVQQTHEPGDLRRDRRDRRRERALQKQPRDDKAACRRREREEEALREQLPDDAPRDAPSDRRMPISRWRETPRASSRLATLAQPIIRISPKAKKSGNEKQ